MHGSARVLVTAAAIAASLSLLTSAQAPPRARRTTLLLRFDPGSTTKVEQLVGEEDKQRHAPSPSRTVTRYGIEGTDLGYSFEHDGRVYFLFGDTVGTIGRALDTIATTDARDPESGVRLDFLTGPPPARGRNGGARGRGRRGAQAAPEGAATYLTVNPPGVSMGAFEVPVSGISLDGRMYIVVSTDHSNARSTDRSVLTRFSPPDTFDVLRTISKRPSGTFIKMSLHLQEPSDLPGLPPGLPYVLMWGTGEYRRSDAYLAIVPAAHFDTGQGTKYFAGLDAQGAPTWSAEEGDAVPVAKNGTMGDVSVTWAGDIGVWLMTYDSRPPAARGIEFSYAPTPWGPWAEPQLIFSAARDGAFGAFIHDPRARPPDGLAGPVIGQGQNNPEAVRGGEYAPYLVERWTKKQGSNLDIYYTLSTWNPYVVVLMKTALRIE